MAPRLVAVPHMGSAKLDTNDLEQLRDLILHHDRQATEAMVARLEAAIASKLSEDTFFPKLRSDLAEALRQAERDDPRAVSRALAPAVVRSIRQEIVNSREEMVEALYPITGRMVRAAVRDAIGGIVADINRRLDNLTSATSLKARFKAIVTRRPVSEFIIAESVGLARIVRAMLIDRQHGGLIYDWSTKLGTDSDGQSPTAIASSMFAAISAFASERYGAPDSELRTIDLNGRRVMLRHSARHLFVVEYVGEPTTGETARIERIFADIIDVVDDPVALANIPALAKPEQAANIRPKTNRTGRRIVLLLVITAAMLALAVTAHDRIWFANIVSAVEDYVNREAPHHIVNVIGDRGTRTIVVRGLVPEAFSLDDILTRIADSGVLLRSDVEVAASAASVLADREVAAAREALTTRQVDALEARLNDLDQGTATAIRESRARPDEIAGVANSEAAELKSELTDVLAALSADIAMLDARIGRIAGSAQEARSGLSGDMVNTSLPLTQILSEQHDTIAGMAETIDMLRSRLAGLEGRADRMDGQIAQIDASAEDTRVSLSAALDRVSTGVVAKTQQQRLAAIGQIEATRISFSIADRLSDVNEADMRIAEVAALARAYNFKLFVHGFSDATGNDQTNQEVSEVRASKIASMLVANGIDVSALTIVKRGAVSVDADGKPPRREVRLYVAR
jgi:outer membrane protein OmpA-like peptidoglycan-associated protein